MHLKFPSVNDFCFGSMEVTNFSIRRCFGVWGFWLLISYFRRSPQFDEYYLLPKIYFQLSHLNFADHLVAIDFSEPVAASSSLKRRTTRLSQIRNIVLNNYILVIFQISQFSGIQNQYIQFET